MSRYLSAASLLVAIALVSALALPAAGETSHASRSQAWLDSMEQHFQAHPELMTTPSSGWKPYNRTKWYREQRRVNGQDATSDDLWRAWEAKQQRLSELGPVTRSTASWFSLGPANFSGRILDIEFDATNTDIIYAGSASGGLWKSTDHGLSWLPKSDELPSIAIGAVACLPWDPTIVLIGTGEGANGDVDGVGILKSTDSGDTWAVTDFTRLITAGHGFHVMEVNPTNQTILAGASDGLWRSTDDGDTWIFVRGTSDFYDVKWKPGDPNRVYTIGTAGSGNNVKVSTDDGVNWSAAGTGGPPAFSVGKSKLAVSAAEPTWVYALFSDGPGNMTGVYRSTDDGVTWAARNTTTNIPGGQGWYNLSLAVDPDNANTVIAAGVRLYRSTNGGVNFSNPFGEPLVHVDHHAIAYEPGNNSTVFVGSDGGIWESTDDGIIYSDRNNGLVTYQFYDICVNNFNGGAYYALGGTQDQGTDKWSGTTTWSQGLGGDGMVCMINPEIGTTVFAETQNGGVQRNTTSGNGGWTGIGGFSGAKAWVNAWAEDQIDGTHLYAQSSNGIFRSTNSGTGWTNVSPNGATWIDFHDLDGSRVWTVGGAAVRVTTDDGANWTLAAPFGFSVGSGTKVLAHPTDLNTAFVTFSGFGVLAHVGMTTDLGASWADVTGDFPSQPVNAIAVDPDNTSDWYIGTDNGVWISTDGGATWLPCDTSLPNVVISDLEIAVHQRKLVAGTYGRGLWEMDLASPGTAAGEPQVVASRNAMLDPPSPNPVSDRTMLRWAARYDGPVSLEIFDVQGRRVMELETLSHGDGIIRTTPWFPDGRPAGVYFAVVRAGAERVSQKIIVTR